MTSMHSFTSTRVTTRLSTPRVLILLSWLALLWPTVDAFTISSHSTRSQSTALFVVSASWKQQPGESSSDYMKRITQLASDPTSLAKNDTVAYNNPSQQANTSKRGYQRVEDWEAEQQAKAKELSWDEKVQFDGQRFGNRYQQNEILRRNLKGF